MNKAELVKVMSEKAGITRCQAACALESFFAGVGESLKKDKKIVFVGFGTFKVTKRAARKGLNPQTKKEMKIPAKKVVRFVPGKKLRDVVA
ncbi:MAG: HU family DNA-binding protein [Acidobacteria bacterium]|jgi:DNA-binding protein HU-beta|nr:HU family DNA-binding protein [Acidobacteriota bacterium]